MTEIIITNVLPSGTAFAITAKTQEVVFIPSKVAGQVSIGSYHNAQLIPNKVKQKQAPWMAIKILEPTINLRTSIISDLESGPATASEIANEINASVKDVTNALASMFTEDIVNTEILYSLVNHE
jgi:hypothetical protein